MHIDREIKSLSVSAEPWLLYRKEVIREEAVTAFVVRMRVVGWPGNEASTCTGYQISESSYLC